MEPRDHAWPSCSMVLGSQLGSEGQRLALLGQGGSVGDGRTDCGVLNANGLQLGCSQHCLQREEKS